MSLDDIVNVSITIESSTVTQPGFGTILVYDSEASSIFDPGELVRSYTAPSAMSEDGFSTTGRAYKAVSVAMSQNPRVTEVKVGVKSTASTQLIHLTPTAVNLATYSGTITSSLGVAEDFSYTADGSATVAEIVAGLIADINANANAVTATDGTTHVIVTADVAGAYFTFSNLSSNLALSDRTAASGIAADLDAIASEDNDWYALVATSKGFDEVADLADWTEANEKIFLFSSQDSATLTNASDDVFSTTEASSYNRTAYIYHQNTWAFAEAGYLGRFLPYDPGSETWVMKNLAGVAVSSLTNTQQTNLKNKKAQFYITIASASIVYPKDGGKVASGEYIDVIRFRDWLKSQIQLRVFALLNREIKVSYTDAGYAQIEGEIRAAGLAGERVGGLVADSFVVFVPRVADADPLDKAARLVRNFRFSGQLAGAIHAIIIQGTISV